MDLGTRYVEELAGQLRCFDRVILHGTLIDVAHPGALLVSMQRAGFRPRDLTRFAQPITGQVREHIIGLAREHGVEIEMVVRKNFRQEDRVAEILKTRGRHPGLAFVLDKERIGMTFSRILRAMLRQAPNIVMIGEIRDLDTANIAVQASLTGHLVFSTLHTNDAPSAVTRLIDIGVKPFLVASSIRAIMAQRLIRKVCQRCKEPYHPTQYEMDLLKLNAAELEKATIFRGRGCGECGRTGYHGRMGIYEIFELDEDVRQLIYEKVASNVIRSRARELGMRTLREDGVRKIMAGITTPEEVISITQGDTD